MKLNIEDLHGGPLPSETCQFAQRFETQARHHTNGQARPLPGATRTDSEPAALRVSAQTKEADQRWPGPKCVNCKVAGLPGKIPSVAGRLIGPAPEVIEAGQCRSLHEFSGLRTCASRYRSFPFSSILHRGSRLLAVQRET